MSSRMMSYLMSVVKMFVSCCRRVFAALKPNVMHELNLVRIERTDLFGWGPSQTPLGEPLSAENDAPAGAEYELVPPQAIAAPGPFALPFRWVAIASGTVSITMLIIARVLFNH